MGKTDNIPDGESRRLLGGREAVFLLLALAVCGVAFFLLPRGAAPSPGNTARLYIDGQEVLALPLADTEDRRIPLWENYGMPGALEVRDGQVRFVDVTCPDHICEKTGFIAGGGQTAVCMPNRAALIITEPAEG